MFYTQTTFLGIDPTAGQKPFSYAALDHERHIMALGHGTMEDVLAFVAGQRQAVVAVCAPQRPNQGLLQQEELRQSLSPPPRPGRWTDFRLAEYLLRQHNLSVPQTLSQADACPNWMQVGFRLFKRLETLGYRPYPEEAPLRYLEVYPYACYAVMLGVIPFNKYSLEGRIQRQLALHEHKLNVPDAMNFFEEITRHRLLNGILPLDNLYTPPELDALVAAYTAWAAALHPEQITCVGDAREGQIVLPVEKLKPQYS